MDLSKPQERAELRGIADNLIKIQKIADKLLLSKENKENQGNSSEIHGKPLFFKRNYLAKPRKRDNLGESLDEISNFLTEPAKKL